MPAESQCASAASGVGPESLTPPGDEEVGQRSDVPLNESGQAPWELRNGSLETVGFRPVAPVVWIDVHKNGVKKRVEEAWRQTPQRRRKAGVGGGGPSNLEHSKLQM